MHTESTCHSKKKNEQTHETHIRNKHCATKIVLFFFFVIRKSCMLSTASLTIFSVLNWKRFQSRCCSANNRPSLPLSKKIVKRFQVISDVMSLALCLQAMSKAPQHFRSPRHKISVNATLFSSIAIAYRYPHPNWFFLPAEPSVYMTTSYVLLFSEFLYEKLICGFILLGHTLNNCKEHKSLRLM